jgi:hypothetical protein
MINAEVMMQMGNQSVKCIVKGRTVGPDGKVHETYDENRHVNTVLYAVEFPDGQVKE